MSLNKSNKLGLVVFIMWLGSTLFSLAVAGVVIGIIIHFIKKFW